MNYVHAFTSSGQPKKKFCRDTILDFVPGVFSTYSYKSSMSWFTAMVYACPEYPSHVIKSPPIHPPNQDLAYALRNDVCRFASVDILARFAAYQYAVDHNESDIVDRECDVRVALSEVDAKAEINERLCHKRFEEIKSDRYEADEYIMSQTPRILGMNITVITLPHHWVNGYVNHNFRQLPFTLQEFTHRGNHHSIFILNDGYQFMPIFFLSTISTDDTNTNVIRTVPSHKRHTWLERIFHYYGFYGSSLRNFPSGYNHWVENAACMFDGSCECRLGNHDHHDA